jgi:hypothetical protein
VFHKSVYAYINASSSVISGPIELKSILVHFSAHFHIFVTRSHLQSIKRAHVMDGLTFETSLLAVPTTKK